jgi:hypothetical protein
MILHCTLEKSPLKIHINISRISQIAKLKESHVWNIHEIRIYLYAANKSTDLQKNKQHQL